jgi:hypothetical protein
VQLWRAAVGVRRGDRRSNEEGAGRSRRGAEADLGATRQLQELQGKQDKLERDLVKVQSQPPPSLPVARVDASSTTTATYTSNNHLITVTYPAEWKAETVGQSVIQISRELTGNEDEDLTFISIPTPISQDLKTFTKVLIGAEIPKLNGYAEVWRKGSNCSGNVPGTEIEATWVPPNGITYKRWSCTFLKDGHGYSFAYDVPKSKVSRDEAVLKTMIDTTKFN